MQTDSHSHHTNGETSPLPPPSPTTLSSTFRHHPPPQATPTGDNAESSIRHLTPYNHADSPDNMTNNLSGLGAGMVRISVQTPFGDLGGTRSRRKEGWPLLPTKTISSLKDDLINGKLEGAGTWEKDGMRIVYHGRIVRDHETLSDVIGKFDPEHVYVFHLVARRIPVTPLPTGGIMPSNLTEFPLPSQPIPSTTFLPSPTPTSTATFPIASTVNSLALGDTIHYLLFTSRHHLFSLLGLDTLKWEDMIPPPIITQDKAREGITSVVKSFALERASREEGWENWQGAFEGDTIDDLKKVWETVKRDGVEKQIRSFWSTATGKNMIEGEEKVQVEVDGTTHILQLPSISQLTATQLTHLLIYLRITTLLPLLEPIYHQSLLPTPTPTLAPSANPTQTTTTGTPTPPGRVVYRGTIRLRIPFFPVAVLPHLFWSAVKIAAMIWMLTRGMKWNDSRFWVVVGMAGGWYMIDALNEVRRVTGEVRARTQRENIDTGEAQGPNEGGNQVQPGQNQNQRQAPPAAAQDQGQRAVQGQAFPHLTRHQAASLISQIHLSTDSEQLRLPPANVNGNSTLRPPARSRPSRIQTQLLLPVLLWFITLVPEWESLRARAIRSRERNMRVIVGENQPQSQVEQQDVNAHDPDLPQQNGGPTQTAERPLELPEALSVSARKYYLRVLARGEGIDWEEEREAQRALGVGEEEEGREGMRLRML
ncbi:uncharacterized protein IL334_004328 [Kwoniella shivajii]|uniref:Ubiquitin-like domain-containing protein n=1 Tax=Kwoniella shivajii TaxID=564305 RepID=A0ABZ1D006_9TREE|nr:hypothetical protein IL334_004328 [Kwoniella shivajii]